MAVTAIWPYKGRIRDVVDYVMNPEKTAEAGQDRLAELHPAGPEESGAAGEWRGETKRYVSCLNCSERYAAEQFAETQRLWSAVTGRDKTEGRTCFHGYQSFREDEVTAETAHEIGVKLAERMWGNTREAVVATHCNTGHVHNHFVLNAVSFADGRKERTVIAEYRRMRNESDRLCLEYGVSVEEDPAGRSPGYGERLAELRGKPTLRSLIRGDIDRAAAASLTAGEFFRALEEMGYELGIRGEDGRPSRTPALKPPGAEYYFAFHRLGGRGYALEEIMERVAGNRRRKLPFPEEEKRIVRAYRERLQPDLKATGLRALYLRYCFELHILVKHPASARRVPFSVRQDLIRLDRLDEQTRFLAETGIETAEDLDAFRENAERELKEFAARRKRLWGRYSNAEKAGKEAELPLLKQEISAITEKTGTVRKRVKLCAEIGERSKTMEEKLRQLAGERTVTEERRENGDEHVFERGGGAGRADDAGRD